MRVRSVQASAAILVVEGTRLRPSSSLLAIHRQPARRRGMLTARPSTVTFLLATCRVCAALVYQGLEDRQLHPRALML